ncbi:motile sperm domain-containing protein 1-like [Heterodontus francisci]|uniref:motile sperm domain-containing protein 1-like n=1 Tax=Heterodontus francisci TaxID=7792 RepID=UPI00355B91E2
MPRRIQHTESEGQECQEEQRLSLIRRFGWTQPLSTNPQGRIPVFIIPGKLTFQADDQSSHKQVLTLYNPYTFRLKFKVLCTVPHRYKVLESDGCVKPQSCLDIIIRHTDIRKCQFGIVDWFRVEVYEDGSGKHLGRRNISAVLQQTKGWAQRGKTGKALMEKAEGCLQQPVPVCKAQQPSLPVFALCVMLGITCIVFLMLPLVGQSSQLIPAYLHLTVTQKLVAAYVLGLVTMALLQR